MPHATLEYSANLDAEIGMAEVCAAVHKTMMASGLFELGAIRVRAVRCEAYEIADGDERNAFVSAAIRIATGRSAPDRRKLGESVMAALQHAFAKRLQSPYFALSVEVREIDPQFSWKDNAMHARLRGK